MPQYLFSIQQPDGPPPADLDLDKVMAEVGSLNQEMKDAGAWVFGAGLTSPDSATVVRRDGDEVLLTDGPYVEGKEHVGGLTIVDAADLDEALEWAQRLASVLAPLAVEVRAFAH